MSYFFILWLNDIKKEERGRKKKEVEERKIFPRVLSFPWSSILWVKYKGGSTCLALLKFAEVIFFF